MHLQELNSQLSSLSLRKSGLSSVVLPQRSRGSATAYGGMVLVRTGFAWATLGEQVPPARQIEVTANGFSPIATLIIWSVSVH